MPLFAAGAAAPDAVAKYADKKSANFEGSIDPMTMLAVIRAQNESEEKIKSDLVDPIIDMTGSDKPKKKKKKKRKESERQTINENEKMQRNEVESKKGIYYDHQAPPGSLFCTDKNGDQENRIFKKIYNGELPLYKPLYKFTGPVQNSNFTEFGCFLIKIL